MESLIETYRQLVGDLACMPELGWDEFVQMCEVLACVFDTSEEAIAEWLSDNIQSDYSINCRKELKPHGSPVIIVGS